MTFLRHDGERRRDRRAKEVYRKSRRRRFPEEPDRRRPLQIRQQQTRHRGRAGGLSRLLAACRPHVKTIVMRSVPEATTRALMLKTGEADMVCALDGPDAQDLQKTPGIRIVATKHASIFWINFDKQWDEKSPWHDKRLRLGGQLRARPQGDQRGRLPQLLPAGGGHRAPRHGFRTAGRAARPMIRRRQSSCSRRQATRTGWTPANSPRSPVSQPSPRRSSTTSTRSASASGCARWSGRLSTPRGRRRSCRRST